MCIYIIIYTRIYIGIHILCPRSKDPANIRLFLDLSLRPSVVSYPLPSCARKPSFWITFLLCSFDYICLSLASLPSFCPLFPLYAHGISSLVSVSHFKTIRCRSSSSSLVFFTNTFSQASSLKFHTKTRTHPYKHTYKSANKHTSSLANVTKLFSSIVWRC